MYPTTLCSRMQLDHIVIMDVSPQSDRTAAGATVCRCSIGRDSMPSGSQEFSRNPQWIRCLKRRFYSRIVTILTITSVCARRHRTNPGRSSSCPTCSSAGMRMPEHLPAGVFLPAAIAPRRNRGRKSRVSGVLPDDCGVKETSRSDWQLARNRIMTHASAAARRVRRSWRRIVGLPGCGPCLRACAGCSWPCSRPRIDVWRRPSQSICSRG